MKKFISKILIIWLLLNSVFFNTYFAFWFEQSSWEQQSEVKGVDEILTSQDHNNVRTDIAKLISDIWGLKTYVDMNLVSVWNETDDLIYYDTKDIYFKNNLTVTGELKTSKINIPDGSIWNNKVISSDIKDFSITGDDLNIEIYNSIKTSFKLNWLVAYYNEWKVRIWTNTWDELLNVNEWNVKLNWSISKIIFSDGTEQITGAVDDSKNVKKEWDFDIYWTKTLSWSLQLWTSLPFDSVWNDYVLIEWRSNTLLTEKSIRSYIDKLWTMQNGQCGSANNKEFNVLTIPETEKFCKAGKKMNLIETFNEELPNSCLEIKERDPSNNTNGIYTINIWGNTQDVYCDMETDWGWWTLIWKGREWWEWTDSWLNEENLHLNVWAPEWFSPSMMESIKVDKIINNKKLNEIWEDNVWIKRASDDNWVGYQNIRWTYRDWHTWSWIFNKSIGEDWQRHLSKVIFLWWDSGEKVVNWVNNTYYYDFYQWTSQANKHWTVRTYWVYQSNYEKGFGYGGNVNGGWSWSTHFLYQTWSKYPIPYAEVYIRERYPDPTQLEDNKILSGWTWWCDWVLWWLPDNTCSATYRDTKQTIVMDNGWRKWTDGKVWVSCKEYINSWNVDYPYEWNIWSWTYWIKPETITNAFKVYCDMESFWGWWTLYLSTPTSWNVWSSYLMTNNSNWNCDDLNKQCWWFTDVQFTEILQRNTHCETQTYWDLKMLKISPQWDYLKSVQDYINKNAQRNNYWNSKWYSNWLTTPVNWSDIWMKLEYVKSDDTTVRMDVKWWTWNDWWNNQTPLIEMSLKWTQLEWKNYRLNAWYYAKAEIKSWDTWQAEPSGVNKYTSMTFSYNRCGSYRSSTDYTYWRNNSSAYWYQFVR